MLCQDRTIEIALDESWTLAAVAILRVIWHPFFIKPFSLNHLLKTNLHFQKAKFCRLLEQFLLLITDRVKGTPLILKAPLSFFKVRNEFFVKRGYFVSISIYCGILTDCKSLLLLLLRLCSEFVATVLFARLPLTSIVKENRTV